MENKSKSFVKGAAILGIAGLIVKAIGAVYRIPLANIVGVEGMSFYEVAYPYYSWLLVISSAGLPTAISKLVSERVTRNDYANAYRVFRVALKVLILVGIFTAILMYSLSGALAGMSGLTQASLSFKALSPALLLVSVMCAFRGYLQGLQRMTGTAISQVIEQVFKLIIGFSLAVKLLPKGPEYAAMGALIGVSVSELAALIVIYFIYLRNKRTLPDLRMMPSSDSRPERQKRILKLLLGLSIPITIGASIMPLTGIADSAMILNILEKIGFAKETAQAAYSILRSNVTVFINMPAVLTVALAMSLVPAISANVATGNKKVVRSVSRTGLKLSIIIGVPCTIGLFLMARPIISLLFTRLTEQQLTLAEDLMRTSSIGVLFLSLVQASTGIIQGLGKPVIPVIHLFFGGVMKVVTMLILMNIPSVNIQGAAISTVVCYAAAAILDFVYLTRKTGMRINVFDMFIKPFVASVIMGAGAVLVYNLLQPMHAKLATVVALLVAVVIYAGFIFALKMLSPEDLAFMPMGGKIKRLMYRK